jgi:transmembrane sensor
MEQQEQHITLIFKYLSGDIEPGEEKIFFDLLKASKEFEGLFKEYEKIWQVSGTTLPPEIESIDLDAEWQSFKHNTCFDNKIIALKTRSPYYITKIAAAILIFIFIGAGALYTFIPKNETLVAENVTKESKLPDGTKITVNKHSKITYNDRYNKKERKVRLEGDAFFSVEKDPEKPFIIDAETFYVEVLGTQFYVNTNENERKVVVTEGRVAVYRYEDKRDMIVLTAGEEVLLDKKESGLKKAELSNPNYLSWKTKVFAFKDQRLDEVCKELERVYDVKFKFVNPELKSCRLSVAFENQEIEGILNVLTATFEDVTFKIEKDTVFVDGKACD